MSHTRKLSLSTKPRLSGLVCGVALMLMYAQVATSAVMAMTGARCSGDQVQFCGHGEHDMSTMDNCSISCCHNTEQPAVHANL